MVWKEVRLGDVCEIKGGKRLPKGINLITQKNSHPYIRVRDLGKSKTLELNSSYEYVDEITQKQIQRYITLKGDILISIVGTIGLIAIVGGSLNGANLTENCVKLVKLDNIDSEYLYYYLKSPLGQQNISRGTVGAVQAKLPIKNIQEFNINCPVLISDQRRIASILSSLDRKIELNNKINADLEEMAQAIFKNWFVDFEPFKDGKFVDSELGMIPEGWKVGTLGDITKNKSAKVKERNDVKVLSPVTTGELVLSEEYFTKQVFSSSIAKYKIVNKGDFAYNPARVNIGSLGRNEFDFDGCVSPVYVVFSVLDGYENYFDLFRKTDFFKDSVASLAIGGVRQSLSYDDLSSIEVIIPSENAVEEFNNLYNQMKKTIKANKLESSRLSSLRDTLLPRLMSGELEVPE